MIDRVPDIAAKRAALTPSRVAFEDLATGRTLTYRQFNENASLAASALRELGVERGDRVAILCRNRMEFFEILFACGKLGAILVPLNWRMPPQELSPLLEDCDAAVIVFGFEDEERACAAAPASCATVPLDGDGKETLGGRARQAPPIGGPSAWRAEDPWYLLYTSGTTGTPKAVIQTYAMAVINYLNIGRAIDLRGDDATLNFLPLFHTAGINLYTLPTLIAGGRVLLLPGFDADNVVALLEGARLDTFFGVPAVYQELSRHPRFDKMELTRVRSWGCGGAPLPDALAARFGERGVRVCNGYGMTETGPTAFLQDPERALSKIGSVGRPQLLVEARIVDANGVDVDEGLEGEIWLRGPGVTPGYWERPQATAETFSQDGWLKTGDLGRRDGDGDYFIVGRIKEMYISGGENVYPAEVENALAEHEHVLEAAVVGVPDAKWGEVGRAYVMATKRDALSAAKLAQFCRKRLAAYKIPKSFVLVEDFPRTAAGKVRKHLLEQCEQEPLL